MGWREIKQEETYTDEEVEARLKEELPHWYLENGWIRRKYKTSGWKSTLMVVNTVGHLAEAAFHHPDLTVSYAFVIVKLMNHAAKGITKIYVGHFVTNAVARSEGRQTIGKVKCLVRPKAIVIQQIKSEIKIKKVISVEIGS